MTGRAVQRLDSVVHNGRMDIRYPLGQLLPAFPGLRKMYDEMEGCCVSDRYHILSELEMLLFNLFPISG